MERTRLGASPAAAKTPPAVFPLAELPRELLQLVLSELSEADQLRMSQVRSA